MLVNLKIRLAHYIVVDVVDISKLKGVEEMTNKAN